MQDTTVKERPILFRAEMVRAILEGRKTQTRRPVKQAVFPCGTQADAVYPARETGWVAWQGGWTPGLELAEFTKQRYEHGFLCPYGQAGDRLWVRETWRPCQVPQHNDPSCCYEYRASDYCKAGHLSALNRKRWNPSIFMPRDASRLTLEITGVSVERAYEIDEDDAKAEGVEPSKRNGRLSYAAGFIDLWNDIHGGKQKIAHDCYVWVIHFKVVQS